MSFGENLKNVRKQRGVTQEELAEILGVSRQAISKWESDGGYPETEKLLVISKTLNISIDYLLNDVSVCCSANCIMLFKSLYLLQHYR